jgi:hypothetical protein
MSDYSFMKSGQSNESQGNLFDMTKEDVEQLLCLFMSNALESASKYTGLCKRNTITKQDISMGMRLEVLNFFNNNNLIQDLEEIKQEYQQLKEEPIVGYQIEYYNNIAGVQEKTDEIFDTEEEAESYIDKHLSNYEDITLLEITESDLRLDDLVNKDEPEDSFARINTEEYSTLNENNREFIDKIHEHYDKWNTWQPYIPIQIMLKNLIDKSPL